MEYGFTRHEDGSPSSLHMGGRLVPKSMRTVTYLCLFRTSLAVGGIRTRISAFPGDEEDVFRTTTSEIGSLIRLLVSRKHGWTNDRNKSKTPHRSRRRLIRSQHRPSPVGSAFEFEK